MRTLIKCASVFLAVFFAEKTTVAQTYPDDSLGYSLNFWESEAQIQNLTEGEKMLNQNMDSAFLVISESLNKAILNENINEQIVHRKLLGLYHFKKGEIGSSTEQLLKSIELAKSSGNEKLKAISMLQLADVYAYIGFHDKQFDLITEAVRVFEQQKDTFHLSYCYNNLGELFRRLRQGRKSFEYFKETLKLAKQSDNKAGMARAYTNIGTSYLNRKKYDLAEQNLKKGLAITRDINDTQEECKLLVRLGRVYFHLGDFEKAKSTFFNSYYTSNKTQNALWAGRASHFLGKTYASMGNNDSALHFLNVSLRYYKLNRDLVLGLISYSVKNRMYESIGEVDSAYKYFKLNREMKDSLVERKNVEQISNIKWQYVLADKDKELKQIEEKKQMLEAKQKAEEKARIWFWLGLGVLAGLSVLLFYFLRQKGKLVTKQKELRKLEAEKSMQEVKSKEKLLAIEKEKFQAEMEHKNKELATLSMQMFSKSEAITGIREEIEKLKKNYSRQQQPVAKELRQLTLKIDNNMRLDEEWDRLKYQFQEVHQGFYDKLKNEHKDLTQYDLKLCTFIHLGFDTKQMAQMLNVNHESLRKQRYRMRKKMNIPTKEDLAEHIAKVVAN